MEAMPVARPMEVYQFQGQQFRDPAKHHQAARRSNGCYCKSYLAASFSGKFRLEKQHNRMTGCDA